MKTTIITKTDTAKLEKVVYEEIYKKIQKWSTQEFTYTKAPTCCNYNAKIRSGFLKAVAHKYDPNALIVVTAGVTWT